MGWVVEVPSKRRRGTRKAGGTEARWVRHKARWRDPSGKVRSKTFDNKTTAERYVRAVEVRKEEGSYIDPARGRVPFAKFFGHYLSTEDLRPSTKALYETLGRLYLVPAFGRYPLSAIDVDDVKEWVVGMTSRGVGARTIVVARSLLARVLEVAMSERKITYNAARTVRVPSASRRKSRFLTAAELAALADAVPERYRALVLLLGYGGLRIGEAAALKVKHLDLVRGRVRVEEAFAEVRGHIVEGTTKTDRVRTVVIPSFLRDELARHLEAFSRPRDPEALVFTSEEGAPIRQNNFRRRTFYPACDRAGIDPTPHVHDLRHTAVALSIQAGAHPLAIAEMAGHSSIRTTLDVYGHLFEGLQEQTAERLDAIHREAAPANVVRLRG